MGMASVHTLPLPPSQKEEVEAEDTGFARSKGKRDQPKLQHIKKSLKVGR